MAYSFGVPGPIIWTTHVLIGLYFIYLGNKILDDLEMKIHGIILIVLGFLMILYHIHIYYTVTYGGNT